MTLKKQNLHFESRWIRTSLLLIGWWTLRIFSFHNNGFTTGPTLCLFKLATGYPCPVCGTTRAIAALSEGHLGASMSFNPLGFILVAALILWTLRIRSIDEWVKKLIQKFAQTQFQTKIKFALAFNIGMWSLDIIRH